ncbi:cold shock domain-containing protein [Pseudomonas sp. Z4-20]|uniref:cold shock domain-containing protein n=1 Tax=Pseudomonas sp. Z4-20 TaxID=2817414 RepID=UPI003DA9C9D4
MRFNGKVKWFNNAKGYGFINEEKRREIEEKPEEKPEDLFAHYSAIQMDGYKTLKAGQEVTFDKIQGPKGVHAIAITPVTVEVEVAPVAARARVTENH